MTVRVVARATMDRCRKASAIANFLSETIAPHSSLSMLVHYSSLDRNGVASPRRASVGKS